MSAPPFTSFTTSFLIEQTPGEAFDAVTNPRGWWSEKIEGNTDTVGDEFTYRYGNVHYCRLKVLESVRGERAVWLVLENSFNFIDDQTEWVGTKISFEIVVDGDQTQVHFTHLGLVPEYECYDICSNAWATYINGSLRRLITTGVGRPNRRK